jgi:hypothetical protein
MTVGAHKSSAVAIVAGRYSVTLPTLNPATDDQEVAELPIDNRTRLIINAVEVPGADGTQWLTIFSTALASKLIVSTVNLSTIRSVSGRLDATAASGTYFLQCWNLDDVPADTTVVGAGNALMNPLKIVHTLGTDDEINVDFDDGGTEASAGITFGLSTTEFAQTAAGAFLSLTASYALPS